MRTNKFALIILTLILIATAQSDMQAQVPFPTNPEWLIIDSTEHLYVFKPQFHNIDIECGVCPDTLDNSIIFCGAAAFTGSCLDTFYHENIAGNHVSHHVWYPGYFCKVNRGGFVYYEDGHWQFFDTLTYNCEIETDKVVSAYQQGALIMEDTVCSPYLIKAERKEIYRSLCETRDGELCVAMPKEKMEFAAFVTALKEELHAQYALYMDMGTGWNYSWYLDANEQPHFIFPQAKMTQYQTNWIVFRR